MITKIRHSYVYTHFEMGDSIICNGLVRHLLSKIDRITLFGKTKLKGSMEWLYKDAPAVDLIFFDDYPDADTFIKTKNPRPILKYGFDYITNHEHLATAEMQFDAMFYHLANVPFSLRWKGFQVPRDINREKAFFDTFNIQEHEYIFVHDTFNKGTATMRTDLFSPNTTIIKPIEGRTQNIFDYMYMIENAKEIHCVDSSFKNLVDSMTITCPLYYHKNRPYFDRMRQYVSTCFLNWTHVEYFNVTPTPHEWFKHCDA